MFNNDDKFMQNCDLLTGDLGNEKVIMSIKSGKYYDLGITGSEIWDLIGEGISFDDLIEKLMQKYNVSKEQCIKDTAEFLESLVKEGIIIKK